MSDKSLTVGPIRSCNGNNCLQLTVTMTAMDITSRKVTEMIINLVQLNYKEKYCSHKDILFACELC